MAYAARRCEVPQDAADVVAETFTVAWRRVDELPEGAEATLWLYGVARKSSARSRAVASSSSCGSASGSTTLSRSRVEPLSTSHPPRAERARRGLFARRVIRVSRRAPCPAEWVRVWHGVQNQ
ncbi:hypothetical protein [Nonomuraea sp. NPDC050783]|uniref:hypothetical protein n=1 Tax=Nonomuraea sp. NPDC050783 TaxID=3154634 RepID=UPI00346655F6